MNIRLLARYCEGLAAMRKEWVKRGNKLVDFPISFIPPALRKHVNLPPAENPDVKRYYAGVDTLRQHWIDEGYDPAHFPCFELPPHLLKKDKSVVADNPHLKIPPRRNQENTMSASYQDQGKPSTLKEDPVLTYRRVADAIDNTLGLLERQIKARKLMISDEGAAAFEMDLQLVLLNLVEQHAGAELTEPYSKPLKPLTRGG